MTPTTMTQWNMRATWLMGQLSYRAATEDGEARPTELDLARRSMAKWRELCEAVPARALEEAAHVGLHEGAPRVAVKDWRRGALVLSGPVGTGKTVAAAWAAYMTGGSCLWLNAGEVAQSEFEQRRQWSADAKIAGLVVLDDVGAGTSGASWAAPKLAELMAVLMDRRGPSVINTNMSKAEIGRVYSDRIISRINQQPNAWVACKGVDRRVASEQPKGLDVLPPREARALRLMHGYQVLERARQAQAVCQVDAETVIGVARDIGIETYAALDERVAQSERRMAEVQASMAGLVESLRPPPPDDDPDPC